MRIITAIKHKRANYCSRLDEPVMLTQNGRVINDKNGIPETMSRDTAARIITSERIG